VHFKTQPDSTDSTWNLSLAQRRIQHTAAAGARAAADTQQQKQQIRSIDSNTLNRDITNMFTRGVRNLGSLIPLREGYLFAQGAQRGVGQRRGLGTKPTTPTTLYSKDHYWICPSDTTYPHHPNTALIRVGVTPHFFRRFPHQVEEGQDETDLNFDIERIAVKATPHERTEILKGASYKHIYTRIYTDTHTHTYIHTHTHTSTHMHTY
jgi:hypothetical protein